MLMRFAGFATVAALMAVAPLAAQEKGTFEIGGFGRYTDYTNAYLTRGPDDNRIGGGGRIGFFVANNLALEFAGSINPTDLRGNQANVPSTIGAISRPLRATPINAHLVYNAPISGAFSLMLGAGPSYTMLTKGIEENYLGVGGLVGLRIKPTNWFNLRIETLADYIPSGFGDNSNTYLGHQAGASILFGNGGCDHSKDMIGITPMSATLAPGASQQFTADATYCGKPDAVVYRLSGPGSVDSLTGRYTAAGEGTAQVMAYSRKGKLMSTANVTVRAPAPAPRPAPAPAPAPPPPAKPAYAFALQMVHFKFDRSDLTQGGMDTLNVVATTLKEHPEVNVDVIGHTDWISTNAYNMKLSQARAETVKKYLVSQGVAADRIAVKWRGEEEPIADNKNAAGRAQNRRVEIMGGN
jgi:outer membrane protein OmpA-like peptidoglycan-associated protein